MKPYELPQFTAPNREKDKEEVEEKTAESQLDENGNPVEETKIAKSTAKEQFVAFSVDNESVQFASPITDPREAEDQKIELSAKFSNIEFVEEGSLLTNAETYSKNIRKGAEIYSERLKKEAEIIYAKADDLKREVEAMKKSATEEKQIILKKAHEQVGQIKSDAYDKGFEEGKQAGIEQRYKDSENLVSEIMNIIEELNYLKRLVRFQSEQDLVQLALLIAKNVVLEEITLNSDTMEKIIKNALKEIDSLGKIKLYIHPQNYDFLMNSQANLQNYLKEEQSLVIRKSSDVKIGSVQIETDEAVVNHAIEKQFKQIEDKLSTKLAESYSKFTDIEMDDFDYTIPDSVKNVQDEMDRKKVEEAELGLNHAPNQVVGQEQVDQSSMDETPIDQAIESEKVEEKISATGLMNSVSDSGDVSDELSNEELSSVNDISLENETINNTDAININNTLPDEPIGEEP